MDDDDKKLGVNIHQLEKRGIVDSDFIDVGAWFVECRRDQDDVVVIGGEDCLVDQVYI